jgi:pimeloyl-ACP methyl ester carboxylesterase
VLSEYTFYPFGGPNTGAFRLNYADSGGPKPPFLLLHGATLSWQTFLPLIPALSRDWRVLALDLRGHGKSGWVPGGYRFVDYSEDVKSFLKAVAAEPTVVLGHSFAGYFALQAAAEAPGIARAVILLDTPLFYRRKRLKDTGWYRWFDKAYSAIDGATTKAEVEARLAHSFADETPAYRAQRAERLIRVDPESLRTFMEHRHMEGYRLDDYLRAVECPVLLVQADPSLGAALEAEDVDHALSLLTLGSFVQTDGAGHMMHASHPGMLLQYTEQFLNGG